MSESMFKCTKCAVAKPTTEFRPDRTAKRGHRSTCRECERAYARERGRAAREAGVCRSCRVRPAAPGYSRCEACREYIAKYSTKYRAEYTRDGRSAESERRACDRRRRRTPEEVEADRRRLRPHGLKRCRGCGWQQVEAFSSDITRADGLKDACRSCANAQLWRAMAEKTSDLDMFACVYCGATGESLEVEHVLPKSGGGTDEPLNLVPACTECNRGIGGKHDRPVLEWLADRYPELVDAVSSWPVVVVSSLAETRVSSRRDSEPVRACQQDTI